MKWAIIHVFCILLVIHAVFGAMSEKQFKAAIKLVRNVCMPKNKITEEQLEEMQNGKFDEDRGKMCYIHCLFNMQKMAKKDNTIDLDGLAKALSAQLPTAMKDKAVPAVESCQKTVVFESPGDKCANAYMVAKCIYDFNPEGYFLP